MLGEEDRAIVAPAVTRLRADGIDANGPLPADTLFHKDARTRYDAALCMYHDQALIPIKTLAFDHAVNVTLGLPIVRTSPDHGTAFDIAGKGTADPTSLVAALRLAARLASAEHPTAVSPHRERTARPIAAAARRHSPAWSRCQEIARPKFSARSQPGRTHRARGGNAGGSDGAGDRFGARRADARPVGARRRTGDRGRARPAGDRGAAGHRGALSGPARHRAGRRADFDRARLRRSRPAPHRRQPALQYRNRAAGLLDQRRAVAALVRCRHPDVPARGRRAHRRPARLEELRAALGASAMALRSQDPVRRASVRLRAGAESHLRRSFA